MANDVQNAPLDNLDRPGPGPYLPLERIDLVVRDCAPGDIPAIQAIYAPHVLQGFASFEELPPDAAAMAQRRDEVIGRGLPFLVAEERGKVMAYAYAGPFRLRSAYRYTVEDSIYVARDALGRGIGRTLLAELVARCTSLGLRQMIAVTGTLGASASVRMHERLGFRAIGVLPQIGWKRGQWLDATLLQLTLGPGGSRPPDR
ncbi:MAG: N-acetyltransferase [Alphaproteobacteria bacterium]|nr:N-acetyltransferase [Alphaproteobacteria bacterium]